MNTDGKKILLFDGVCNLCNASVQFIIRHDYKKQFLFASLQGDAGRAILRKYDLPTDTLNSFVLIDDNKAYTKSDAALRASKYLRGGWKLLNSFLIIPKFIRDAVYTFIAKNRYRWFGKKESCWIPTPELADRFLD